jgi:putative FmdB family regulatory protein
VPVYEYVCQACNKKFEQLVRSMSDEHRFDCPACGSPQTARTLSVFAVGAAESGKSAPEVPMCGRCGGPSGSCAMD